MQRSNGWVFKGTTDKGKHEMCVILGFPAGLDAEVFIQARQPGPMVERMTGMGLDVVEHGKEPRKPVDVSAYLA